MGGKTTMKGAMKKSMKKAMKASKIARGKLGKSLVLRGSREKTAGVLTRDQLIKNKRGKVVSKLVSQMRRKRYAGSRIEAWMKAVRRARKELGITGFVTINGPTAQGKALYAKAKAIFDGA